MFHLAPKKNVIKKFIIFNKKVNEKYNNGVEWFLYVRWKNSMAIYLHDWHVCQKDIKLFFPFSFSLSFSTHKKMCSHIYFMCSMWNINTVKVKLFFLDTYTNFLMILSIQPNHPPLCLREKKLSSEIFHFDNEIFSTSVNNLFACEMLHLNVFFIDFLSTPSKCNI